MVQHAPAGDAVPEFERDTVSGVGFGGDLRVEVARVGIKQRDGTGIGVKGGHDYLEDLSECGRRIIGPRGQRGQAIEGRKRPRIEKGRHGDIE